VEHLVDVLREKGQESNMSKVFVSMGISLDGYVAGPNRSVRNMGGDGWGSLHAWLFGQRAFREKLELGEGGETGADNRFLEAIFDRTGANVMGKRMFEEGERSWPEEPPFHTQVFVLSHEVRAPWERKGGTTFHFVNDGIETALRRAREAAGDKDVRISGGGATVLQVLNAGLVDELLLSLAPTFLGGGVRLFEGIDKNAVDVSIMGVASSPQVTHLRYALKKKR
jgi:dihydrofolate reductase